MSLTLQESIFYPQLSQILTCCQQSIILGVQEQYPLTFKTAQSKNIINVFVDDVQKLCINPSDFIKLPLKQMIFALQGLREAFQDKIVLQFAKSNIMFFKSIEGLARTPFSIEFVDSYNVFQEHLARLRQLQGPVDPIEQLPPLEAYLACSLVPMIRDQRTNINYLRMLCIKTMHDDQLQQLYGQLHQKFGTVENNIKTNQRVSFVPQRESFIADQNQTSRKPIVMHDTIDDITTGDVVVDDSSANIDTKLRADANINQGIGATDVHLTPEEERRFQEMQMKEAAEQEQKQLAQEVDVYIDDQGKEVTMAQTPGFKPNVLPGGLKNVNMINPEYEKYKLQAQKLAAKGVNKVNARNYKGASGLVGAQFDQKHTADIADMESEIGEDDQEELERASPEEMRTARIEQ